MTIRILFIALMMSLCSALDASDMSDKLKSLSSSNSSNDQPVSVAGVRGLEEEKVDVDTKVRDYPAIDKLEQVKIKPDQLARFIEDGKLK